MLEPSNIGDKGRLDDNKRERLCHFLNLLIPMRSDPEGATPARDFFECAARQLILDIMVSLDNAALSRGEQPSWNMGDVLKLIGGRERGQS